VHHDEMCTAHEANKNSNNHLEYRAIITNDDKHTNQLTTCQ